MSTSHTCKYHLKFWQKWILFSEKKHPIICKESHKIQRILIYKKLYGSRQIKMNVAHWSKMADDMASVAEQVVDTTNWAS